MNWIPFSESDQDRQPLPPERRYVLVQTMPRDPYNELTRPAIAVGYMKFGAGCEDSPYFVVPSVGGEVSHWCNCLGDDFCAPGWAGKQSTKKATP